MKTIKLYSSLLTGLAVIFGSCELNSPIKTSPLPETISNFKTSEQMEQFKTAFPAYADHLQYDAHWKEAFDGEEVYAIPSIDQEKIRGVLYMNSSFKIAFEIREFNGPTASITIGDVIHDKAATWQGKRIADHLYSFELSPANKLVQGSASRELYVECVARVYFTAHSACYGDPTCTTMCDILPACTTNMFAAAAWTCL